MATKREKQLKYIHQETSIKAGPILINFKLGWLMVFFPLTILVPVFALIAKVWWAGLGFDLTVAIFFLLYIWKNPYDRGQRPRLAKRYRQGNKNLRWLTGRQVVTLDQPERGEFLGTNHPDAKPPPKYNPLGRLEVRGFSYEDGSEMGWVWDGPPYKTASATMRISGSSLLSDDETSEGERLLHLAGMLNSMSSPEDPVRYFAWHDMKFRGEKLRPGRILEQVRGDSRLTERNEELDAVFTRNTVALGQEAWRHRTTLTLTIDKDQAAHHIRRLGKGGSVEALLSDRMGDFYDSAMGTERGESPLGLRNAQLLSRRDLIVGMRLVLDPVFAQAYWEDEIARQDGPYLDSYDAFPGFTSFDEEHEGWDGCIKLGQTFHRGLHIPHPSDKGLTSEDFWEVLRLDIRRTVTVVMEIASRAGAMKRARWGTAALTKKNSSPAELVAYEAAERHEMELARNLGQAVRMRCYIDVWGATPAEVNASLSRLLNLLRDKVILGETLDDRQYKIINAVVPAGRGLWAPPIPDVLNFFK